MTYRPFLLKIAFALYYHHPILTNGFGDQTDADVYNYVFMQVGRHQCPSFNEVPSYEFAIPGKESLLTPTAIAK